jgi:hypothetical protein
MIGRREGQLPQETAALRDFDPVDVRFGSWLCENARQQGLARRDSSRQAAVGLLSKINAFES